MTADLVNGKTVAIFSQNPFVYVLPSEYEKFEGKTGWMALEKKLESGAIASFIMVGDEQFYSAHTHVQLYPRKVCCGVGCRRGIKKEKLEEEVLKILDQAGIAKEGLATLATAWVKADERGILALAASWQAEMEIFQKEEILEVADRFGGSDFVQATIGVPCVSEPCGFLSAKGGTCIVPVQKNNGITISLWLREEGEQ